MQCEDPVEAKIRSNIQSKNQHYIKFPKAPDNWHLVEHRHEEVHHILQKNSMGSVCETIRISA